MSNPQSDALVFFGATGDLAFKKIFPALQALAKRGHLEVPVIGVARPDWTADQLRDRARDSLAKQGGVDPTAFEKLCGLLRYVRVDYSKPTAAEIAHQLGIVVDPDGRPLTVSGWGVIAACSLFPLAVVELVKVIQRVEFRKPGASHA